MKNQHKKAYNTPKLSKYGSFVEITLNGGTTTAIDGLTGLDLDGDGTVDVPLGVTLGSM